MDYLQAYPAVSQGQVSFSWQQRGSAAMSSRIDHAYRLTFGGLAAGQEDDLLAIVQLKDTSGRDSSLRIGQCRVVGYPAKSIPLYLIPVGLSASYDQQAIASTLNDIYRQAVISWQVQWLPAFATNEWDVEGKGTFINSDANTRMDYTPSMRALVRAFKKANNTENNAVYVFLVNLPCSDASLMGFMPFSKQFGFVFVPITGTDAATLSRTIAHEVAHGTFILRHTFTPKNPYVLPEGSTNNLMDYSGEEATALNKYQWDLIHNPQRVWFSWLQEEGEGASQVTQDPICVQKFLEQYRYAFVKKQKLIYPKDGYPYFGHYAKNIKLLDGNTYKKIHISIYQDLGSVPLKLISQLQVGTYCYYWGNELAIYNNDKNTEFSKYLYPSSEEWDKQMSALAAQIGTVSTTDDALKLLAIMPLTEYYRLSSDAIAKSIGLISSKFAMTEDYFGCINDEEIINALVESCEGNSEKKRKLLYTLSKGNAMNRFIAHLDGDNLKKFVITVSKYTNEIMPPNMYEITQNRFNSFGVIYSHLFDWQETLGPDIIFESENAVMSGDFVISTKTDWLAILQDAQYLMRIKPFEYVGLMADDVTSYLPELVKPKETIVMMPAFLFHWLLTQKKRDQTMKDFSNMLDLGLSVVTLGSYTTGKVITKVCIRTAEGMVIDFGIQAFINTLDGTSIQEAVNQVDWKNVFWSGASSNIDNTKVSLALGCIRGASRGALNIDNNSIKEAIINAGTECFLDILLSMVSKGIVKVGNKYFQDIKDKIELSPEFVVKRLLKYGFNKAFINDIKENIIETDKRQQIDKAIAGYEKENKKE